MIFGDDDIKENDMSWKEYRKKTNIILTSNGFHNETKRSKKIDEMFEMLQRINEL